MKNILENSADENQKNRNTNLPINIFLFFFLLIKKSLVNILQKSSCPLSKSE